MFETNYRKPLVYAIGISLLCLLVLAFSVGSTGGGLPDTRDLLDVSDVSIVMDDAISSHEDMQTYIGEIEAINSKSPQGATNRSAEATTNQPVNPTATPSTDGAAKQSSDATSNQLNSSAKTKSKEAIQSGTSETRSATPEAIGLNLASNQNTTNRGDSAPQDIDWVGKMRQNSIAGRSAIQTADSSTSKAGNTATDKTSNDGSSKSNGANKTVGSGGQQSGKSAIDIGNGSPDMGEQNGDLSFLSVLSKSLLSDGHQALLIPTTTVSAKDFMERVQNAAKQSPYSGNVRVHVNFDAEGHVASMRITDNVDESLKAEAERIIQSSGTIYNQSGGVVYMYIPVTLGQ